MTINWFLLRRITRALWFLPALFSLSAVAVVAVAYFSPVFFPDGVDAENLPVTVSTEAVRSVMTIVASSMLAVAVFSLSTLVTLMATVAQGTSPRAVPLILADRTAQTSISIFIGAFLFCVVGIIGLSGEIYSTGGRLVLFVATGAVVIAVVWALIRWIGYLSGTGRVGSTIDRVEEATASALARLGPGGLYGCRPMESAGNSRPDMTVKAHSVGYVQHFDPQKLQKLASRNDLEVLLLASPGTLVDHGTPLLALFGKADEKCCGQLRAAIELGHRRTFDYDPQFGLTVLVEIGRRALSPALNDAGTAEMVIASQIRLLERWARNSREKGEGGRGARHDRVFVERLQADKLLRTAFHALIRDAAGSLDVTLALLGGLRKLAETSPAEFQEPARMLASEVAQRAELAFPFPPDAAAVSNEAGAVGARRPVA